MSRFRTTEGRWAGSGTQLAFIEHEETWEDVKVDVRLPSDSVINDKKKLAELSGPVKTYRMEGAK